MVDSIKSVLMHRDEMTEQEAEQTVSDLRTSFYDMLAHGEDPSDIMDELGLEPDYLEELFY